MIRGNKGVLVFNVFFRVDVSDEEPPKAGNDIGDHKHNDNEPKYLVRVHNHVLGLDPVGPGGLIEVRFDQPLDPTDVEQFDELGQPRQPDQLRKLSLSEKILKWEGSNEVQEHPT